MSCAQDGDAAQWMHWKGQVAIRDKDALSRDQSSAILTQIGKAGDDHADSNL